MKKTINIFFTIGLIFYIVFLIWTILLKSCLPRDLFNVLRENFRSINLIPFNDLLNSNYNLKDIVGNIILFIPLGIYIGLIFKNFNIYKKFLIVVLISFTFEISQYIFALGASDITDIITNSIGGLIGIISYFILKKILKDTFKTKFFITICSTLLLILVSFILIKIFLNN